MKLPVMLFIALLGAAWGCRTVKPVEEERKVSVQLPEGKDSLEFARLLDRMPVVSLPYDSRDPFNEANVTVDTSRFTASRLFGLRFRPLPTEIGDHATIDDHAYDDVPSFDLIDGSLRASWKLIVRRPNFVLVGVDRELDHYLVSFSPDFRVLDAIRSGHTEGNNRWSLSRDIVILENLDFELHNNYNVVTDPEAQEWTGATTVKKYFVSPAGRFLER